MSHRSDSDVELKREQKSRPTSTSNSFIPTLSQQTKSPLPPIHSQQNEQLNAPKAMITSKVIPAIVSSTNDEVDLVLPTKVFDAKKTSVNDLSQVLCSHLWFRRIKEIFVVMGKENDPFTLFDMKLARTDMIQTCDQYLDSQRPLSERSDLSEKNSDKADKWKKKQFYAEKFRMCYFRQNMNSDEKTAKISVAPGFSAEEVVKFSNAIWWYSCNEAPIFDQMNNILRLENFELLMCHRYYMSDLCQMIERSYAQSKREKKFTVFRADKISSQEYQTIESLKNEKNPKNMKHFKGPIIAINGFISTSQSETISLDYAKMKLAKQGDDVVIMYEITIDPTIPCSAYADIESISFAPREREVLFTMGSTFQIDGIKDDPSNPKIKRIKLTACDFNHPLLDEMKTKVKNASQATLSILLIQHLIELGEDRASKRYVNQLLQSKQLENDPNLAAVYNCLGTIYFRQALYGDALAYYHKALNTQARLEFSNSNALAEIFNYIGQARLGLDQLDEAQENLEEGIRIQKRESKHAQQHLATLYCNMGQVAYARHEYEDAEEKFQLSHDLYNQNTKISHDALEKRLLKADLYIAFGHLKSIKTPQDPAETKKKFEEALELYECTLPPSHPKVAEAHIEIVCEYAQNKQYQSVIKYYNGVFPKLMKIYETQQATSQQDLANLYAIIGACFAHEGDFDQAMEIWKKSIKHQQTLFLDELLSPSRISKIELPVRLVDRAYRIALEYYSEKKEASREYLAILHAAAFMYDEAIEDLRGENSYLLANLCVIQRKFKGSLVVYERLLKLEKYDLPCLVGILLKILTTKKTTYKEASIAKLTEMEMSILSTKTDTKITRLRMIINDYLAEAYLTMEKYNEALRCSRTSFDLKQHHYSSRHPSLARSCQLIASCSFHLADYTNALQYYEKAVEIQLDNMPSGHTNIRSNYFLLGDCYCKMGKKELANESYERALPTSDIETVDGKEIALIRMHSNLAEVSSEKEDYFSACTSQQEKIDLLKKILPTYAVKMIEYKNTPSITFDHLQEVLISRLGLKNVKSFAQVLRNLVFIHFSLARVLLQANQNTAKDEDSTDLYGQAIELELKLTMFENLEDKRLANLYEELSQAYAKLYSSMTESIQDNLIKVLDAIADADHQRAIEYRLGNLCFDNDDFVRANQFWKQALVRTQISEKTIKERLEELITKSRNNLSTSEESIDEESERKVSNDQGPTAENDENNNNQSHSRVQSAQSKRHQSINDQKRSGELAQACLKLEDYENALKHLSKQVLKSEDLSTLSPTVELTDEQVPMIEFFHSLLLRTIAANHSSLSKVEEVQNKETWTHLLDICKQIFTISVRLEKSSNDIATANFATLKICQKLYNIPENITTVYSLLFDSDINHLKWDQLRESLSSDDYVDILMRVAAYHEASGDHENAFQLYFTLQPNIEDQDPSKNAVNYAMLKLIQVHIRAEDEHRPNIMAVDIHSVTIPIFDRILLCQLIISFWEEIEDKTMADQLKTELFTLQNEMWTIDDLETVDCIGKTLTKFQDNALASLYWNEIRDIYHEMLPESIVTRLYSDDYSFEQILHAIQEMNNDLAENIIALAQSYETLATYEESDECIEDACRSLEQAILFYDKCPTATEKIQQLKAKAKALKEQ